MNFQQMKANIHVSETKSKRSLISIFGAIALRGLLGVTSLEGSPIFLQNTENMIENSVKKALEMFQVPGAAIGLIIDGQVVLARGFGCRNLEQKLPVTENTLFRIASCTKAFTALILGQLAEEGKISFDDPVVKYLAEFRSGYDNTNKSCHHTRFVSASNGHCPP